MSPEQSNMGLTSRDLDGLAKFDHTKTLLESQRKQTKVQDADGDLRSLRSEYDYGSKRKFVDVLGNKKRHSDNGLKGLDEFKNHEGAKNMESAS